LRNAAVIVRENVRGETAIKCRGKPLELTDYLQQPSDLLSSPASSCQ
jgi:hypothetical protein